MATEANDASGIVIHEVVNIEEFEFDEELQTFFYPCPCGDKFLITMVRFTCFYLLRFSRPG
jgi:diphthamide biosynthesis protein 3